MPQLPRLPLTAMIPLLVNVSMMLTLSACGGSGPARTASPAPAFGDAVHELAHISDSAARASGAALFAARLQDSHARPMTDSSAFLWYHGAGAEVYLAGDLNGWNPRATPLRHIPQTLFFWTEILLDPAARLEYKFVVDGRWILDPANPLTVQGGFSQNSELRMPDYQPPEYINPEPGIAHGTLDTLQFNSAYLQRAFRAYVYTPPLSPIPAARTRLPSITVGDGAEYIEIARMPIVLDNLIAQNRIAPMIAVFLESRSPTTDSSTQRRLVDYWLNASFAEFLARELRDTLQRRYPVSSDPKETAIMGASLGGLLATYVTLKHPDVYGLCGAQSPAYWVSNDSIFNMISTFALFPRRVYIDTGTLHDAQEAASRMRDTLEVRGCRLRYVEVPEGHNWSNWRSRLDELLLFLFGDAR